MWSTLHGVVTFLAQIHIRHSFQWQWKESLCYGSDINQNCIWTHYWSTERLLLTVLSYNVLAETSFPEPVIFSWGGVNLEAIIMQSCARALLNRNFVLFLKKFTGFEVQAGYAKATVLCFLSECNKLGRAQNPLSEKHLLMVSSGKTF